MYYLESNTTFFTNPRAQRTGGHPHSDDPVYTRLCERSENLKKILLTYAHYRALAEKITDTKKVYPKLLYQLLNAHKRTRVRHKEVTPVCVRCITSGLALKLARVCACSQLQESKLLFFTIPRISCPIPQPKMDFIL